MRNAVLVIQSSRLYRRLLALLGAIIVIIILMFAIIGLNVWIGSEVHKLDLEVECPPIPNPLNVTVLNPPEIPPCPEFPDEINVTVLNPPDLGNITVELPENITINVPPIEFPDPINVSVVNPPLPKPPKPVCIEWTYALPFVCGESFGADIQDNHTVARAREYAFTMWVFNPQEFGVTFEKKVSYTFPPEEQAAGPVVDSPGNDTLETCEALEMNCQQIRPLAPPPPVRDVSKRDTFPLIKGVVSLKTNMQLLVWGAQTSSRDSATSLVVFPPDINNPEPYPTLVATDAITYDKEQAVEYCSKKGFLV